MPACAAAGGRAGLVVVPAGPAGRPVPAAARGRRARHAGQRRMVRRAVLRWATAAWFSDDTGRVAGPCHRAAGRSRQARAVPGAGRRPGQPGDSAGQHRPARRGGRRGPQGLAVAREIAYPLGQVLALEGLTFAAQYAGDLDGAVQLARQAGQVTAGDPRRDGPVVQLRPGRCADRRRGPGRRRGRLRGGPGPGPGRGRPVERGDLAVNDGDLGPGGGPHPGRRGAPAGNNPARHADRPRGELSAMPWTAAGCCARRPGAPPRPSRCGPRTPRCCGSKRMRTRPRRYAAGKGRCAGPGRRSAPAGPAQPKSAARR